MNHGEYLVVEKSHLLKPVWLKSSPEGLHFTGDSVTFLYTKDYVLELPLGLQQAQEAALLEFRSSIARSNMTELLGASECSIPSQEWTKLDRFAFELSQLEVQEKTIKGVYFEGGKKELTNHLPQKFYEISILLEIPMFQFSKIREDIVRFARKNQQLATCFRLG